MMRNRFKFPAGAEIPDEQAHREFCPGDFPVRPAPAFSAAQQLLIGGRGAGVRDHDVGRDDLAAGKLHPGCGIVLDQNFADRRVGAQPIALAFDQLNHAPDQCAGAAGRKMHTEFALKVQDQTVDGAGIQRIAADQQRVKAKRDAQPRIADFSPHQATDAAIA